MPDRDKFSRAGVDAQEFAAALAEALSAGGADEETIAEAMRGVEVDASVPDDSPEWRLYRHPGDPSV
ncbi:hypothetical protein [Nonomuraea sp. NPDC048826]|uniref:hypothetical protein n=1 Tax=Nonomuraea sp. NPDC048826 TaxID=3364347 RepID=UPI00371EDF0F